MKFVIFAAGVAIGYIFGARAGRKSYERLRDTARKIADSPPMQNVSSSVGDLAGSVADRAAGTISDALGSAEKKIDGSAG
jgi:hypothetical protein